MATLLDHPQAQALLDDASLAPDQVRELTQRLAPFLQRYLPFFQRAEQQAHAGTLLRGKLSHLDRKTTEPIAQQAGHKRRPLQHFVGAGAWSDDLLRYELNRHVGQELGDPQAVLALDGHAQPKKGRDSCGVARQWCGRLGKVENCQQGYFLAYLAPRGRTLIDAVLYLPQALAADPKHRKKTYVPEEVTFAEGWSLALGLLKKRRHDLPHRFVTGDDEFGRVGALRQELRYLKERYVLDVPSTTTIRDLSQRRPPRQPGGRARLPAWESVAAWAARQPTKRWKTVRLSGGEKGPRLVRALQQWVQTKDEGHPGARERLVVIQSGEGSATPRQTWYTLSNAAAEVPLREVVEAHGVHHGIEELFAEGCGEVGLNECEVRSWTGWAHHLTLTLLALWFLQLGKMSVKKKTPGITVSQLAGMIAEWLRNPEGGWERIAAWATQVLQRTEESRIYAWYSQTGTYPPPRPRPGAPPGEK